MSSWNMTIKIPTPWGPPFPLTAELGASKKVADHSNIPTKTTVWEIGHGQEKGGSQV